MGLWDNSIMTAFKIEFPEDLPVSSRRHEIQQALEKHQVIIVCGETGSGKTTQLPKIALAMGRGRCHYPAGTVGGGRLIAHTQPRRIAASSVAKRIAQELQTPLGEVVGYKVRFQDKLSASASVKLMTDGILLAETQSDPLLQAYDTIIIDEAHERSLNIDFLLGYLKQILPRRPDLKIIVTSATIDADRFARHFESRQGPAPVIMVSGRMFPVEQRYRPFEERKDYDLNDAIADAVQELWQHPSQAGDILIFFPGEREIREAAEHLRGFISHHVMLRQTEILPLFARLSQAEQDRVFEPSSQRRIVLATNVAETSLTVPGIRYVIDTGTARVKRYSYRSKVEQLLVEPISQAAARQRAGRCGRVADGICIRLYDEASLLARSEFTDPEILRSSLAAVILRMKSLRLGVVEDFPFIDAPSGRAIADGYQLLQELGAVDEFNELTALGQTLSRLPLDPRLGRMLLAGKEAGALAEILVITSALSVQDVRDRPLHAQAQADAAHAKFDDEKSEFMGFVKLWNWLAHLRGGGAAAHATPMAANPLSHHQAPQHKLSNRQQEQQLRDHFINVRRVREWRDIHSQLLTVVNEQKWRLNTLAAHYDAIHQSLLAGLLGNIGFKSEADAAAQKTEYLGARGIKFFPHPGAHLSKKPGRWIMAAELVETTRLFGRGIASIDPLWIEKIAGHLLKKQLLDPHWEKKLAHVVAFERATLYGLTVYAGRRAQYHKADPVAAREIFIRSALVEGDWDSQLPFVLANKKLIAKVQELEHQSRRQDVLVDDELIFAFYDQLIPADVYSGQTLEYWYKKAVQSNPKILQLSKEELMRHEAAGITTDSFPKTIRLGGVDCLASYLHDPGDPKDGVTVTVPLFVLNQVNDDRPDWLVPGMLKEKIIGLIKSLPQKPRARLVPVPENATQMALLLSTPERFAKGSLIDALVQLVKEKTGLEVRRADFKTDMLPTHLLMNIRVVDETGRQLGAGRQIGALKAQLGQQARGAFAALAQLNVATTEPAKNTPDGPTAAKAVAPNNADTRVLSKGPGTLAQQNSHTQLIDAGQSYTQWSFGHLPELLELQKGKQKLIGFPALVDRKEAVVLEVFDEPDVAKSAHLKGLRRLFALQLKEALKYLEKNLPDLQRLGTSYMALGSLEELKGFILDLAIDRAFLQEPLPSSESEFKKRLEEGRSRFTLIANEIARIGLGILLEAAAVRMKLKDSKIPTDVGQDMQAQLQALVGKRFLLDQPYEQLQHFPRYLKAMVMRIDKLKADPARDKLKMSEFKPLEQKFWRLVQERKGQLDTRMQEMRWLLEELRVSLFAQELRTPQPVSVKRLEKVWAQLML